MPSPAYAHGEEVLFLPVGQILAIVGLFAIAKSLLSLKSSYKLLGLIMALLISIPVWFIPGNYFPDFLRYSVWGNFLLGLVPPLVIGVLVFVLAKGVKLPLTNRSTTDAPNRRAR